MVAPLRPSTNTKTMRALFSLAAILLACRGSRDVDAFAPIVGDRPRGLAFVSSQRRGPEGLARRLGGDDALRLASKAEEAGTTSSTSAAEPKETKKRKKKKLGLITFDLDDTLYPIQPVMHDANEAFSKAMKSFGFKNIAPQDIVEAGMKIRAEVDPSGETKLTHKDVRLKAIRQELEKVILQRKLVETADDWATDKKHLAPFVVESAKKWASVAVSSGVVQAVYNAWEMERYHSAERNLYPEVMEMFRQLKAEHPDVIIGAVTDGSANPLLMTFTLGPFFDFCISWEDDNVSFSKSSEFRELSDVEGSQELAWIYDVAYEKYKELAAAAEGMKDSDAKGVDADDEGEGEEEEPCWIHIGDDLAYDVGGSAQCGAKTILVELVDEYGQTERKRYAGQQPPWDPAPYTETKKRKDMAHAAEAMVDAKVARLSLIPEAVSKILEGGEESE